MEQSSRVERAGLRIATDLDRFVADEVLAPLGIGPEDYWSGAAAIIAELGPRTAALLERRNELQAAIDSWHRGRRGRTIDADYLDEYKAFLYEIGYLEPAVPMPGVEVSDVDPEIAMVSGPQLVVPVSNARYALNAANARWGSLYDALYGTDVIGEDHGATREGPYNPVRGERVIAYVASFLDDVVPLEGASHAEVTEYRISTDPVHVLTAVAGDATVGLADPAALAGFTRAPDGTLATVFLEHHGLHVELVIDRDHPVGRDHRAGVADVVLEAAVTTIQDCEDSVAAVDAADKVAVYRNWLGLMRGDLVETFAKGERRVTRALSPDRDLVAPDGSAQTLPGRSLMLVRNVGHLMTTDAVLDPAGQEVSEGILDALVTIAIGAHDVRRLGALRNSRAGSIYIVKPKLHGSAEVQLTVDLFAAAERLVALPENTVKVGIMDEERRTTLNLPQCIAAARHRVIFINTGFLDRTGDEIHTSMEAGPMIPKGDMKASRWLTAYEDWNVDVGLACGLHRTGQIGKGMWAMPDEMAAMVDAKIAHPQAGANTAWVPSPTAATLHAMHYHRVDVAARQDELAGQRRAVLDDILALPILDAADHPAAATVQRELDNNAQGILGYVVRWVDQGVGCSKVPDINDVGLMEDRATLRISSQHIANWLHHGLTTPQQVQVTFRRMAEVVDRQNAGDPAYRPMATDPDHHPAFQAAMALVLSGTEQPSGYTEPVLHAWRRRVKGGE
jgi:malate synthase